MKTLQELIYEGYPRRRNRLNKNFSAEFKELLEKYDFNFDMQKPEIDGIITDILRQLYYGTDKEVAAESIRNFCEEEGI